MISFKDYFHLFQEEKKYTEHRKSPHDKLLKYVNDPNLFVSFTGNVSVRGSSKMDTWQKIGINPYNRFRTPTAIYTYPLVESEHYIRDFIFPYAASGATSAWVLRAKRPERLARSSTYTAQDLKRDLDTLEEIFSNYDMDSIFHSSNVKKGSPIQTFWGVTRLLAYAILRLDPNASPQIDERNNPVVHKWAFIMNHFYDGFVDDKGEGFIHESEPIQACFFSKAYLEVVEHIHDTTGDGFLKENWFSGIDTLENRISVKKGSHKSDKIYFSNKDKVKMIVNTNQWDVYLDKNGKKIHFGILRTSNDYNPLMIIIPSQYMNISEKLKYVLGGMPNEEYLLSKILRVGIEKSEERGIDVSVLLSGHVKDYEKNQLYISNLLDQCKLTPIFEKILSDFSDYMSI